MPCLKLHKRALACWLAITCTTIAPAVFAAELEIPLALDYRILQQSLGEQLFTGRGRSVEVYADSIRCNTMELSDPRVEGTAAGQVRILTTIKASAGTPLGGRCLLAKPWRGVIETIHSAHADPVLSTVAFKIVDSNILRSDEKSPALPRIMRKWIAEYIHPRLNAVTIDLHPAVTGIQELVGYATDETLFDQVAMLSSLRLKSAQPSPDGITMVLSLEVPAAQQDQEPVHEETLEAILSADELAQWDASWQAWDGFATWLIKIAAVTAAPELRDALALTLLEARYDLRDALAAEDRMRDPVRDLFLKTWQRLAPLLHESQLGIPGGQALRYATFISAANALQSLDQLAPELGMRLDRYSLRSLARLLVPAVEDADVAFDTAIDPELRQLLGLDPEFDTDSEQFPLLAWIIRSAYAGEVSPALVKRLNGWVPGASDVDQYLKTMEQMLGEISRAERNKGKVPDAYFDIYDALLRATAWQESCWRQFIEQAGKIQPIQSSAGSLGLMQVNKHVWRGVYDIHAVTHDIGYNARAGNEILVHYMVDIAIRKGEHKINNDPSNLARAAYAVYNGGPRHLSRYRNPDSSKTLKFIDASFWQKYQAIQQQGPGAVKQCYEG